MFANVSSAICAPCSRILNTAKRSLQTEASSTAPLAANRLQRSYLYIPSSSEKMLQKSLSVDADTLIFDLEDSVAPEQKLPARQSLVTFLSKGQRDRSLAPERVAVRINAVDTRFFEHDLRAIGHLPTVRTLVLPKIHSPRDLDVVASTLSLVQRQSPLNIIASIESARALWQVGDIAAWMPQQGVERGGALSALLFAAEDYCADSRVIRTPSRTELLYARARISTAAKAFGLQAIDMVCVNYKDQDYLKDECGDGRRLGYDGKQAIHPSQVDIINTTFVPTEGEILRAATIVARMAQAYASTSGAGAFGLGIAGDSNGGKEMIDAPMVKQAENVLSMARSAGIPIPDVE